MINELFYLAFAAVAGFTVNLWDRVKEAQQRLEEADKRYDEIIEKIKVDGDKLSAKQGDAFNEVQKAIEKKSEDYKKMFQAELGDARQTFGNDVKDAGDFIEQQKRRISSDVEEQEKNVMAAAINASGAIEDQKNKFGAGLDLLLGEAKARVDPAIIELLAAVARTAEAGTQKVNGEVQKEVDAVTQIADAERERLRLAAERQEAELDAVFRRGKTALNEVLNTKLADLQSRSNDATKSIDGIVSSVSAAEAKFINGMNLRLADWDQRIALELKRNEDVAKRVDEISAKMNGLDAQLGALQESSAGALEVAESLRTGTKTGELPVIGKVLERSAFLFVLSLCIAGVGALFGLVSLLIAVSRPAAAAPAASPRGSP